MLTCEWYLGKAVINFKLFSLFINDQSPLRYLDSLPEGLRNRSIFGSNSECEMLCLNRGDGVLIIRSELVEPVLCDLVGVEVLKIVVACGGTRLLAKARLKTIMLRGFFAVNALDVRDIARRYQGLGRRVVGRRRIHSGCVLARRYLED
jgi:hypothetical protein